MDRSEKLHKHRSKSGKHTAEKRRLETLPSGDAHTSRYRSSSEHSRTRELNSDVKSDRHTKYDQSHSAEKHNHIPGHSAQTESRGQKDSHSHSTSKSMHDHHKYGRKHELFTHEVHGDERDRRKHRHTSSDGEEEDSPSTTIDYDFEFGQYKYSLSRIFFRDQTCIKRGTKDYDDFWVFLSKYQAFHRKKAQQLKGKSSSTTVVSDNSLGLPGYFDNKYKVNLSLISKDADDFIRTGRLRDGDVEKELTRDRAKQFRNILVYYIDFLQKQKFTKLSKIRHDQQHLPIYQYKQMICHVIKQNQVVLVAGDTGCGKSTQVPQYLLEAGYDNISCTQPRRIAAISLAKRVSFETLNEYGTQVAFQVRFEKTKTRATRILFLTEGLLLRQMSSDPLLSQYNVLVIDEVHERHIHTDFLLGVLKCLLCQRTDLKVILMSATINIHLFSAYFDDAPVVKVPGRLYPISLEYCPITRDDHASRAERLDPSPYLQIMQRIDNKYAPSERGDLLIFLSGMSEIMAIVEAAKQYAQKTKRWIVLPLHSALSISEQDKVFDMPPEGVRKCIVSTNIAETSVTIDGVRFIIDSGKVKEMSFDPKCKMQRLQEFWISRASAEQRKGRAGRTGPGVCFRLYADTDYEELQEYATPEIQRVPIDSLILQLIAMGLPDARRFPFLEAPSTSSVENSIAFLKEQGALREDETLTAIGHMLSRLPVDVVIGKMLIMGSIFHMIDPVLTIAAAMSVQSPFTVKAHSDHDAMAARKNLESDHGDPFTLLNAFDAWIEVKAEGRGTKKWCQRRGLEEQRFYEMTKLKQQFKELLNDHGLLHKHDDRGRAFTSDERRRRHAERKRLNELKREENRKSKRRKVLKLEDDDYHLSDGDGEEDEKESDIKDLEFRLSHDLNKLQEVSNKSRSFTLGDINLLKLILCSGLYPQLAIADDCNSYKSDSEHAFHTKNQPFLLLHPTSVFFNQPDLLQSKTTQPQQQQQTVPRHLQGRLANRHELLSFVSTLVTNKPYLVNVMRLPALQSLMLFSGSLDTNADCTRIISDGWLEIEFSDGESAESIMSAVNQLRENWQNLTKIRLEDTMKRERGDSEQEISPRARRLEKTLARKLSEFLASDVMYAVRRVLPVEMEHMYIGAGGQVDDVMKDIVAVTSRGEPHPIKGGIRMNSYLTVNCLLGNTEASIWGEYTTHMQRHWTCPHCDVSMIVTVLERLQHEVECPAKHDKNNKGDEIDDENTEGAINPLSKLYFCPECDRQHRFTPTEILKHKRSHTSAVS